jgi:drug/metabolite transporter (DMT)-like permease
MTWRSPALATAAVVVAAFCWGLSAIFAKGAFESGIPPERMAEARIAVAGLLLLGFLVLARRDLLRPPRAAVLPAALFGVSLVLVNLSYYVAIDRLPVGVAIALQYTAPVFVLAVTGLVGGRVPGALVWVAGILTLAGAVLVSGAYAGFGGIDPVGLIAGFGSAVSFAMYLLSAEGPAAAARTRRRCWRWGSWSRPSSGAWRFHGGRGRSSASPTR